MRCLKVALGGLLLLELAAYGAVLVRKRQLPYRFAAENFYGESKLLMTDHPYLPYFPKKGVVQEGIEFNSWGDRGPEPESPKRRIRVLCFGGSTTFDGAHRLPDTWPGRLQALLGPRYEVINSALNGATTADTLVKLTLLSSALRPDYVLALEGVNDLEPSFSPGFRPDYSHRRRHIGAPPYPVLLRLPRWLDHSAVVVLLKLKLIGPRSDLHAQFSRPTAYDFENGPFGLDTFRRNLLTINAVSKLHGAKVVLGTPPYYRPWAEANFGPAFAAAWDKALEREREIIRDVARAEENVLLAEVARSFKPTTAEMTDFCHLTEAGNQRVAEAFYAAMLGRAPAGARAPSPSRTGS